jgi:hypothetical protein
MRTRRDHGTVTAIPYGSQQPCCPPGTLWESGCSPHDRAGLPRDTACGFPDRDVGVPTHNVSVHYLELSRRYPGRRISRSARDRAIRQQYSRSPVEIHHGLRFADLRTGSIRFLHTFPGYRNPGISSARTRAQPSRWREVRVERPSPDVRPHEPHVCGGGEDDGIEDQRYHVRPILPGVSGSPRGRRESSGSSR